MNTKEVPLARYRKYKKLLKLVKSWVRAHVMSRSPAIGFPDYGEYFKIKLDLEDQILELLFGTKNLMEVGRKLGLPVDPPEQRRGKRTKKTHSKKLRKTQKAGHKTFS